MLNVISIWYQRYFSNAEAALLILLCLICAAAILLVGGILAPFFASIVIAYILEWLVVRLEAIKVPRTFATFLVFAFFIGCMIVGFLILLPKLWQQTINLMNDMPKYISISQETLLGLPKKYPDIVNEAQVLDLMRSLRELVAEAGQTIFSTTLSSLPGFISLIIYLVLVPILVFFMLFDQKQVIEWSLQFLPKKRPLLSKVGQQINNQLGHYVRGKFAEMLIVGFATFVTFFLLGLNYTMLLAAIVGISVFIPFVGATLVTLPVAMVAFIQFGISSEFAYVMIAYLIIQVIDGNLLVPVLFAGVVDLHPIAIITAILLFGGIWGVWGVFFAIPLAIVIQAVLKAWPRPDGYIEWGR